MAYNHTWIFPSITLAWPTWISHEMPDPGDQFESDEDKMQYVIKLSSLNSSMGTGGPFGAAVFNAQTGQLVAPGVNLVQQLGLSAAHAEMIAISMAQRQLGLLDLGTDPRVCYELFSSTEPCSMCMGNVQWSGIRRLVCGANDADARAIGFDEGVKAPDWVEQFKRRGIVVQQGVCRAEAVAVLNAYKAQGGLIYNGRGSTQASNHSLP